VTATISGTQRRKFFRKQEDALTQQAKWSGMLETAFFSVHTRIPPREISEHEAARQLLKGHALSLLEAVKFAQDHHQPVIKTTMETIIETYIAHRRRKGVSEAQISNVAKAAKRLQRWLDGKPLHSLSSKKFEEFMDQVFEGPVKPKTFNGFLGDVRTFLKWCVDRHYLGADPTMEVEERNVKESTPTTLTPETAETFLRFVERQHPAWIPYAVFCLFGAVRPSIREGEAFRLDEKIRTEGLDLTTEGFFIEGKANGTRLVPWELCGPLKQWLQSYPIPKGAGLWPLGANATQAEKIWATVRSANGLTQDVLRHTAISAMCYASASSLATVALAVGNSEAIIRSNYVGRWSTAKTKTLWLILPSPR
jgi:site-specific recombinase XerD